MKRPSHLDFIRTLPCVICGGPSEPAHLRMNDPRVAKTNAMGQKPDDAFVNPLCRKHHDEQHSGSESDFWKEYGIDPTFLALALFQASGDSERAEDIIAYHRP